MLHRHFVCVLAQSHSSLDSYEHDFQTGDHPWSLNGEFSQTVISRDSGLSSSNPHLYDNESTASAKLNTDPLVSATPSSDPEKDLDLSNFRRNSMLATTPEEMRRFSRGIKPGKLNRRNRFLKLSNISESGQSVWDELAVLQNTEAGYVDAQANSGGTQFERGDSFRNSKSSFGDSMISSDEEGDYYLSSADDGEKEEEKGFLQNITNCPDKPTALTDTIKNEKLSHEVLYSDGLNAYVRPPSESDAVNLDEEILLGIPFIFGVSEEPGSLLHYTGELESSKVQEIKTLLDGQVIEPLTSAESDVVSTKTSKTIGDKNSTEVILLSEISKDPEIMILAPSVNNQVTETSETICITNASHVILLSEICKKPENVNLAQSVNNKKIEPRASAESNVATVKTSETICDTNATEVIILSEISKNPEIVISAKSENPVEAEFTNAAVTRLTKDSDSVSRIELKNFTAFLETEISKPEVIFDVPANSEKEDVIKGKSLSKTYSLQQCIDGSSHNDSKIYLQPNERRELLISKRHLFNQAHFRNSISEQDKFAMCSDLSNVPFMDAKPLPCTPRSDAICSPEKETQFTSFQMNTTKIEPSVDNELHILENLNELTDDKTEKRDCDHQMNPNQTEPEKFNSICNSTNSYADSETSSYHDEGFKLVTSDCKDLENDILVAQDIQQAISDSPKQVISDCKDLENDISVSHDFQPALPAGSKEVVLSYEKDSHGGGEKAIHDVDESILPFESICDTLLLHCDNDIYLRRISERAGLDEVPRLQGSIDDLKDSRMHEVNGPQNGVKPLKTATVDDTVAKIFENMFDINAEASISMTEMLNNPGHRVVNSTQSTNTAKHDIGSGSLAMFDATFFSPKPQTIFLKTESPQATLKKLADNEKYRRYIIDRNGLLRPHSLKNYIDGMIDNDRHEYHSPNKTIQYSSPRQHSQSDRCHSPNKTSPRQHSQSNRYQSPNETIQQTSPRRHSQSEKYQPPNETSPRRLLQSEKYHSPNETSPRRHSQSDKYHSLNETSPRLHSQTDRYYSPNKTIQYSSPRRQSQSDKYHSPNETIQYSSPRRHSQIDRCYSLNETSPRLHSQSDRYHFPNEKSSPRRHPQSDRCHSPNETSPRRHSQRDRYHSPKKTSPRQHSQSDKYHSPNKTIQHSSTRRHSQTDKYHSPNETIQNSLPRRHLQSDNGVMVITYTSNDNRSNFYSDEPGQDSLKRHSVSDSDSNNASLFTFSTDAMNLASTPVTPLPHHRVYDDDNREWRMQDKQFQDMYEGTTTTTKQPHEAVQGEKVQRIVEKHLRGISMCNKPDQGQRRDLQEFDGYQTQHEIGPRILTPEFKDYPDIVPKFAAAKSSWKVLWDNYSMLDKKNSTDSFSSSVSQHNDKPMKQFKTYQTDYELEKTGRGVLATHRVRDSSFRSPEVRSFDNIYKMKENKFFKESDYSLEYYERNVNWERIEHTEGAEYATDKEISSSSTNYTFSRNAKKDNNTVGFYTSPQRYKASENYTSPVYQAKFRKIPVLARKEMENLDNRRPFYDDVSNSIKEYSPINEHFGIRQKIAEYRDGRSQQETLGRYREHSSMEGVYEKGQIRDRSNHQYYLSSSDVSNGEARDLDRLDRLTIMTRKYSKNPDSHQPHSSISDYGTKCVRSNPRLIRKPLTTPSELPITSSESRRYGKSFSERHLDTQLLRDLGVNRRLNTASIYLEPRPAARNPLSGHYRTESSEIARHFQPTNVADSYVARFKNNLPHATNKLNARKVTVVNITNSGTYT